MKLIVFGSTGGTGKEIVIQALEAGHEVTAFARSPEKVELEHKKLKIIEGNVLELKAVESGIQDHEAVICALGMPNIMDKSRLREKGTKNIILGMKHANLKRLICQSALGVGDSRGLLPFHYKYFLAPLIMKHLYMDHHLQEKQIKNSELEWVIVRPGILTKGERTMTYQHGFNLNNKPKTVKISRADVAHFMLKQLDNDQYLGKTPCIAY